MLSLQRYNISPISDQRRAGRLGQGGEPELGAQAMRDSWDKRWRELKRVGRGCWDTRMHFKNDGGEGEDHALISRWGWGQCHELQRHQETYMSEMKV